MIYRDYNYKIKEVKIQRILMNRDVYKFIHNKWIKSLTTYKCG